MAGQTGTRKAAGTYMLSSKLDLQWPGLHSLIPPRILLDSFIPLDSDEEPDQTLKLNLI